MPKVSVIVPVYNVEKYIAECARSLFEQTLDEVEYIFIDDCTPDDSIGVLRGVLEEYPGRAGQVKVVTLDVNSGAGAARNAGMAIATGEYITFCDSDDFVEPEAYESMYGVAKEEMADIVACGVCVDCDGVCIDTQLYRQRSYGNERLTNLHAIEGGMHSSTCNKLFSRRLLADNKIFFDKELTIWDDLYIVIRAKYFAGKFLTVNKAFYHYIMHKDSMTHSNAGITRKQESKIRCAALLEDFFSSVGAAREFSLVISFLKFKAKGDCLRCDDIKKWLNVYPETHNDVLDFKPYYGQKWSLFYYIIVNYRLLGRCLWYVLKR